MAAGPSLDSVAVIATSLEAVAYGFSLLMFGLTLWVLMSIRRILGSHYRTMFVVAGSLFTFSTMHLVVDIHRLYMGAVDFRLDPFTFYSDVSALSFVLQSVAYVLQTLAGDLVVIYRVYVVWQSIWPPLFPITFYVSLIIIAIGGLYNIARSPHLASGVFSNEINPWVIAFYACSLVCNMTATSLLAMRLWSVDRSERLERSNCSSLIQILWITVDSGILYSVTLIVSLICFAVKSNSQVIMFDLTPPIISICFYGVILRVSLLNYKPPGNQTQVMNTVSSVLRIGLPRGAELNTRTDATSKTLADPAHATLNLNTATIATTDTRPTSPLATV